MQVDLADAYRRIDAAELGRRIQNARILAGRTQAELAGDDVTAAYLSRIENGQRKPEFNLLGRIAERAATTLAKLLEDSTADDVAAARVALDHAELSLASGDAASALSKVDALLITLDTLGDDELLAAARQVQAFALEATGDLQRAILLLEDLTASPRSDAGWLKSLIALSRCYRETGDLDRAIGVGSRAQSVIDERGLAGTTEAIQLTLTVSAAYSVRGDLDQAMRMCMRALDAAEASGSILGRASAYWNASTVESQRGDSSAALSLARKALIYFELGEDSRNLARLRIQVGYAQLRADPPDPEGALATLEHAGRELAWSQASSTDRAREAVTRAEAHLLLGHHDEALEALAETQALAPESARIIQAEAHGIAGRIALERGDMSAARAETIAAVEVLTGAGADRDAAQLWLELASRLKSLGETDLALDAYQRAAAAAGLRVGIDAQIPSPERA